MTRRAARELLNLVFRDQAAAELELIGRRRIVDAEDRVTRTDVALGIPMALEAPLHLQRLFLPHERHSIDLPVARRAADALVYVNAVVEVDEVRQIVDPRPLDAAIAAEAGAHRLEVRAVRENLRMTIHAGPRRRDAGKRRVLDRGVAVPAVETVAGDVPLVAELNRLFARDARLRHPRRTIDFREESEQAGDEEHGAKNTDAGDGVRAAMKNLRHRFPVGHRGPRGELR